MYLENGQQSGHFNIVYLEGYQAHLWSGHYPFQRNMITVNVYEHLSWYGIVALVVRPICSMHPNGYAVYEAKGSELKWQLNKGTVYGRY